MKLQEAIIIGINIGAIGLSITTPFYASAFLKSTLVTTVATIALKFFTPYFEKQREEIRKEFNIEMPSFVPKKNSYVPGLVMTALHVASLFRSQLPILLNYIIRTPGIYPGMHFGKILGNLISAV